MPPNYTPGGLLHHACIFCIEGQEITIAKCRLSQKCRLTTARNGDFAFSLENLTIFRRDDFPAKLSVCSPYGPASDGRVM